MVPHDAAKASIVASPDKNPGSARGSGTSCAPRAAQTFASANKIRAENIWKMLKKMREWTEIMEDI